MDRSEDTSEVDPGLAVRIYALAGKANRLEKNATAEDIGRLASDLLRGQKHGTSALHMARRILESAPWTDSVGERHLVECARRCVQAEADLATLRLEYSKQVGTWQRAYRDPFEKEFVSTVNAILRMRTDAIMRLSDTDLVAIRQLIARHATPVTAELIAGLSRSAGLDVAGHDADSAFRALVASCEPRQSVSSMAQIISLRGIECTPDEFLPQLRKGYSSFRPLVETLIGLASAKNDFAGLVEAEEMAYDELLKAYARERWDKATP